MYHILHLGCQIIHYGLKLFHITPSFLYKKFKKVSTSFNDVDCEYVTSYEYMGCLKDKVKKADLLPLVKVPVEKRVNHAQLVIQFEGEDPIYGE